MCLHLWNPTEVGLSGFGISKHSGAGYRAKGKEFVLCELFRAASQYMCNLQCQCF